MTGGILGSCVVEDELDLINWQCGISIQLSKLGALALQVFPMTRTGEDVAWNFRYCKLNPNCKQMALTNDHHLGRLGFAMNGIVLSAQ